MKDFWSQFDKSVLVHHHREEGGLLLRLALNCSTIPLRTRPRTMVPRSTAAAGDLLLPAFDRV